MAIIDNRTVGRDYPLPHPENKLKDDVLRDILAKQAIDADITAILLTLGGKAETEHAHAIGDVTGLADALDDKISVGYHDALDDLSDVNVTGATNGQVLIRQAGAWIPVALQIGNITDLETALDAKAETAAVQGMFDALKGGVSSAWDTLSELAAGLLDRVAYSAQSKTPAEKGQARANIDAGPDYNFLVNPDGAINQRGVAAVNWYGPDQWKGQQGAGAVHAINGGSRFDFGGDFGMRYYMSWARSTVGSAPSYLLQPIEGAGTLAGETVTVEIIGSGNGAATQLHVTLEQNFGTGGAPSVAYAPAYQTITLPTSVGANAVFRLAFQLPSIAGKVLGTNGNDALYVVLRRDVADANPTTVVVLVEVALTKGDNRQRVGLLPRKPAQQERDLCQRYCETGVEAMMCPWSSATQILGMTYSYKATKRIAASPSLTKTSGTGTPTVAGSFIEGFYVTASSPGTDLITFSWIVDAGI